MPAPLQMAQSPQSVPAGAFWATHWFVSVLQANDWQAFAGCGGLSTQVPAPLQPPQLPHDVPWAAN